MKNTKLHKIVDNTAVLIKFVKGYLQNYKMAKQKYQFQINKESSTTQRGYNYTEI